MFEISTRSREQFEQFYGGETLHLPAELLQFSFNLSQWFREFGQEEIGAMYDSFKDQLGRLLLPTLQTVAATKEEAAAEELSQRFGAPKIVEAVPVAARLARNELTAHQDTQAAARETAHEFVAFSTLVHQLMEMIALEIQKVEAELQETSAAQTDLSALESEGHMVVEDWKAQGGTQLETKRDATVGKKGQLERLQTTIQRELQILENKGDIFQSLSSQGLEPLELNPLRAIPMTAAA